MNWNFGFRSIKSKITLIVLVTVATALLTLIFYSSVKIRNQAIANAEHNATAYGQFYAERSKAELEKALNASRFLSQMLSSVKDTVWPPNLSRRQVNSLMKNILELNPRFFGVGVFWERNAFDNIDSIYAGTEGHDETGAFIPYWYADGEGGLGMVPYPECYTADFYLVPKKTGRDMVLNPYLFDIGGEQIPVTTFVSPILHDSIFYGVSGFDIPLLPLIDIVENASLYDGTARLTILSNNGTIVAMTDSMHLSGKLITEVAPDDTLHVEQIRQAKRSVYYHNNFLEVRVPIQFGNTETPWQITIEIPKNKILAEAGRAMRYQIYLTTGMMLVILLILTVFLRVLLNPLRHLAQIARDIGSGNLQSSVKARATGTEIQQLIAAFNSMKNGLKQAVNFAQAIGKKQFDTSFKPLSDYDMLGNALLNMRHSLKKAKEKEDKRRRDDEKRAWTTTGLAHFADMLRGTSHQTETLTFDVIKYLVKYLDANQGGVFLINESPNQDEPFIELTAAFAYNRKKLLTKHMKIGEGLIGRCLQEGETIYMTEIPADYIKITSGLGEDNPRSLLIVPMQNQQKILGAIEMASFELLEPYQIEFVEQVAANLAATLLSIRVNTQTNHLLEQFQKKNREIDEQKGKMQQQIEQLQKMVETVSERASHNEAIVKALTANASVLELQPDGTILSANKTLQQHTATNAAFWKQRPHHELDTMAFQKKEYQAFWEQLHNGNTLQKETRYVIDDQIFLLSEIYTPLPDKNGNVKKIVCIGKIVENK